MSKANRRPKGERSVQRWSASEINPSPPSRNLALVVLRLDHEDSKRRADDMVDLGRVFAIGTGKDEDLRTQLDMDSHGSLVRNPTLWFFVPGLGHSCDPGFDST